MILQFYSFISGNKFTGFFTNEDVGMCEVDSERRDDKLKAHKARSKTRQYQEKRREGFVKI